MRSVIRDHAKRFLPHIGFLLVVGIICTFVVLGATESNERESSPAKLPPKTELPPASEPEGTAMRVMRYVQAGAEAGAATLYHPRAVELVGLDRVTRSLRLRRATLSGARLRVSLKERTSAGELVVVAASGSSGRTEYSFVLRRSAGRWLVINDSLLGDALPELVQMEVQRRIDPSVTKPSPEAVAAGAQAQRRYLRLLSTH